MMSCGQNTIIFLIYMAVTDKRIGYFAAYF